MSSFNRLRPNRKKFSPAPPRTSARFVPTRPRAWPSALVVGRCVSLLFEARNTNAPLRNFDTDPPCPYCYELGPDNRLESVANAHTAADLHVRPWFQTALIWRAVDAAKPLTDTSWPNSRNGNDSRQARKKITSRSQKWARLFERICNVLNLCGDSKRRSGVIFRRIA